jgi:uncharacterized protein YceK
MRYGCRVALLIGVLLFGGCGTIINLSDEPKIYGGLRYDVTQVGMGLRRCEPGCWMIPDVPFSLVLDTVVLPFTVVHQLFFSK